MHFSSFFKKKKKVRRTKTMHFLAGRNLRLDFGTRCLHNKQQNTNRNHKIKIQYSSLVYKHPVSFPNDSTFMYFYHECNTRTREMFKVKQKKAESFIFLSLLLAFVFFFYYYLERNFIGW